MKISYYAFGKLSNVYLLLLYAKVDANLIYINYNN